MKSDTLLDHAVFQLSPKGSRCELFVFSNGESDKLASGFVKPFVAHLKAAEEQIALSVEAIKLEVERCRNPETWFTKGTLERFVRFVSTPEILESVNILDIEMSQLEATQKLYSQGVGDQLSGTGGSGYGIGAASDKTKKELLRVIDMRLSAVKLDLATALSRAASAGFDLVTVSELQMFADQFNAPRLNEACQRFLSLCDRRGDRTNSWKDGTDERDIMYSSESDMSFDTDSSARTKFYARSNQRGSRSVDGRYSEETAVSSIVQKAKNSSMSSQVRRSRGSGLEKEDMCENDKAVSCKEIKERRLSDRVDSRPCSPNVRRLSIRDRINAFEIKKVPSPRVGKSVTGESPKVRKQSSQDKAVLRKWRSTRETSRDSNTENSIYTPSATASRGKFEDKKRLSSSGSPSKGKPVRKAVPGRALDRNLADQVQMQSTVKMKPEDASVSTLLVVDSSTDEYEARRNQNQWDAKGKLDLKWEDHAEEQKSSEANFKSDGDYELKMNFERVVSDPEQVKRFMGYRSESDGDSALKMNFERVVSDPEQVKRFMGYRSESDGDSVLKMNFERAVSDPEQVKRFIGSKGNFELNDKLKMKADELEKLFAEHKLRVPGESSSTRRTLAAANSSHQTPIVDAAPVQSPNNNILMESSTKDCSTMGNNTELVENHGDASSDYDSDFSREKYYDTYLQRRNKKLRDEWSSKREEKEAKLKAMQDSFERSTAEIKANFPGSIDRQNSLSMTRQLAERFGPVMASSYNGGSR